jgi:hypothetical protein
MFLFIGGGSHRDSLKLVIGEWWMVDGDRLILTNHQPPTTIHQIFTRKKRAAADAEAFGQSAM